MSDVRDNPAAGRFELAMDGETAIAAYQREGGAIIFTHTEVPDTLAGRGIGSRLVRGALDAARAERLRVMPACSFVEHFIATHEEYRDLL